MSVSDNVNKSGPDTDQWSSINLGEVASPVKCSIATSLLSIGSEVAEVLSWTEEGVGSVILPEEDDDKLLILDEVITVMHSLGSIRETKLLIIK